MSRLDFLRDRQVELLRFVHLVVGKDEAVAARVRELGQECDRSTITRWRDGSRSAPLGYLFVLLDQAGAEARRRILQHLAEPFGLRVVEDEAIPTGDLQAESLDLAAAVGELAARVRAARADRRIDQAERDAIAEALDQVEREAAEARAALGAEAAGFARSTR